MLIGVLSFSYATGAVSSVIQTYDQKEAHLKEKIQTLNQISLEYNIDMKLFNKLARAIKYDYKKVHKDANKFMSELPHKLQLELSMVIHE